MTIVSFAAHDMHALPVRPIVALAIAFVGVLLTTHQARKAPSNPPRRSVDPPAGLDGVPRQAARDMGSRVREARHELAGRREQRAASPGVMTGAAVARARSNTNDGVGA